MFRRKRDEDGFGDFNNMPWDNSTSWDDDLMPRDSRGQKLLLLIVALVVLGGVIVGGYFVLRGGLFDSPERAAKQWLTAVAKGDTGRVVDLTCSNYSQSAPLFGVTELMGGGFLQDLGLDDLLKNIEIDLKNLRYSTEDKSTDMAVVRASGLVRVKAIGNFWVPVPLNERWQMVKENKSWKWCGRTP